MRMSFLPVLLIGSLGIWVTFTGVTYCQTSKDNLDEVLDKAKTEFRSKSDELAVKLILAIEQKIESARKVGDKKAVDRAQAEREKFEADGTLPTCVEKASQLFQRQTDVARKKLEQTYRTLIKESVRRADDAKADELQRELDGLPGGELEKMSQLELVRNGGCEDELNTARNPAWLVTQGVWQRHAEAEVPPHEGTHYFWATKSPVGELIQDIDVTEFAKRIDGGQVTFEFSGYVRSIAQSPAFDTARILIEFLDVKKKKTLAEFDSNEIASVREWQKVGHSQVGIKGIRWVRIRLQSKRNSGEQNNSYYDSISLHLLPVTNEQDTETAK